MRALLIVAGLVVSAAGGWFARQREVDAWRAKYEAAEGERVENVKKFLDMVDYCDRVMDEKVRRAR